MTLDFETHPIGTGRELAAQHWARRLTPEDRDLINRLYQLADDCRYGDVTVAAEAADRLSELLILPTETTSSTASNGAQQEEKPNG